MGGKLPIGAFVAIKAVLDYSIPELKTKIKCDTGESFPKAYTYLISSHRSGGDGSMFDYGIIRLGYDNGFIAKHSILSHNGLNVEIVNKDGYVCVKNNSHRLFVSIWG